MACQAQRNAANGLHIGCYVVTLHSIATRDGSHQLTLFVSERNGQAVILQLTANIKRFTAQSVAHTLIKGLHIGTIVGIGQRKHRIAVLHLLKIVIQVAAHPLRRRIGIKHLRMTRFELHQLSHQVVELLVTDFRLVFYIIQMIVAMQFIAQLKDSRFLVHIP